MVGKVKQKKHTLKGEYAMSRQEIKDEIECTRRQNCLQLAMGSASKPDHVLIVDAAKAYYEFVKSGKAVARPKAVEKEQADHNKLALLPAPLPQGPGHNPGQPF